MSTEIVRYEQPVRRSFVEQLEHAENYIEPYKVSDFFFSNSKFQNGRVKKALRQRRRLEEESFYAKSWNDLKDIVSELRRLSKDIEAIAQFLEEHKCFLRSSNCSYCRESSKRKHIYKQAVILELVDSENDIRRKADHLLKRVAQIDYEQFTMLLAEPGMKSITQYPGNQEFLQSEIIHSLKIRNDLREEGVRTIKIVNERDEQLRKTDPKSTEKLADYLKRLELERMIGEEESKVSNGSQIESRTQQLSDLRSKYDELRKQFPDEEEALHHLYMQEKKKIIEWQL